MIQEELQKLINDGKLKEAFGLFEKYLIEPETKYNEGQINTDLLASYIEALNSVNKEENADLEQIKNVLREIKSTEDKATIDAKIAEIKEL